jgi:flagellar biosynthesis GTPase FlhF
VENEPGVALETDLGEIRKKTEAIWSDAARYLTDRLVSIETDMLVDRLKTYPMPLKILHDRMMKAGLDRHICMSLLSEVFAEIGSIAENSTKALFFTKTKLGRRIALCDALAPDESILLIGPTGSGKTETAKKLAAVMNDGNGKKIIDITGHLTYQGEVVDNFRGMKKLVVFPAGMRDEMLEHYLGIMDSASISGLIFTKLDEQDRLGPLCNSILKLGRPIAALTGGAGIGEIMIPDQDTFGRILIEGRGWQSTDAR